RGGRDAVEVVLPDPPLVGVLGQEVHAVADGGAGGVVAGDGEEDEEGSDLVGRQQLLAEVVVHQLGGEVVGGVLPPLVGELVHEAGELHARLEQGGDHVTVADV